MSGTGRKCVISTTTYPHIAVLSVISPARSALDLHHRTACLAHPHAHTTWQPRHARA